MIFLKVLINFIQGILNFVLQDQFLKEFEAYLYFDTFICFVFNLFVTTLRIKVTNRPELF